MEYDRTIAYVVGGSTGIGLAIAAQLASRGADILLFARRQPQLEDAVATVRARQMREGQRVEYRQLNVADHTLVRAVMDASVAAFGAPDMLINCAGRAYPMPFEDVTYTQFDETMRINLYGCWNTIAALLPAMKRKGQGYIVNTSSIAGLIGVYGYTDYCASKFALIGFSEALRSELKPYGITVSVLCPPDTDTPCLEIENKTKPAETHAISAGAKLMQPEAVAAALLHGMDKGKFIIVPGADGRLSVLAKRLAPGLLDRYMDAIIRKVQRRRGEKSRAGG